MLASRALHRGVALLILVTVLLVLVDRLSTSRFAVDRVLWTAHAGTPTLTPAEFERMVGPLVPEVTVRNCRRLVECDRNAPGHFSCFDASDLAAPPFVTGDFALQLLRRALPFVHFRGQRVRADHLTLVDVMDTRQSNVFRTVHSDLEWEQYGGRDGFQVWFLVDKPVSPVGNMFVFDTHERTTMYHTPGRVMMCHKTGRVRPGVDLRGRCRYVAVEPGQGIVFGQNTLHLSDFRSPQMPRRAITFRAFLRDPDGTIPRPRLRDLYDAFVLYKFFRACGPRGRCGRFGPSPTRIGLSASSPHSPRPTSAPGGGARAPPDWRLGPLACSSSGRQPSAVTADTLASSSYVILRDCPVATVVCTCMHMLHAAWCMGGTR
jgi:hypothetical protein